MALLPEVPAASATAPFAIRHPTENSTVELPARPTDAALFSDCHFEYWWETGFENALDTFLADLREHGVDPARRAATLDSVKLMLALALVNGLR